MSNWWDADETVATAPPPVAKSGNWWEGDEAVKTSPEEQQALKVEQMVKRANVKQTPEWWADRRREAVLADADPLAKAPALISEPYRAVASAGLSIGSTVARPFSKDAADYLLKEKANVAQVSEAARADDWSPWLSRIYGGAVESLTQSGVAAATGAGAAGIIGSFAATEANQALYDAEQAGLKGNDRLKYAVVQGAIEGTIAAAFQRFAPGLENFVPQIAKGAMKLSGKQFLKMTAQELPEELLTEVGHAVTEASYGIDPNATSAEQIVPRMVDTIAQTVATLGLAQGTARLAQNKQRLEQLETLRTTESRDLKREAAKLGIEGTRSEIRQKVREESKQIQKEIERAEVQPETEVQPDGKRTWEQTGQGEAKDIPAPEVPVAEQPPDAPSPQPSPPAEPAPTAETPVDEARVEELLRRRGFEKRTRNRDFDGRRDRVEATIRRQVAEEEAALQKYPPGTQLEIEGYQTPFNVTEQGKLVEIATGREMGDNAGAILRQYTPEQIRVIQPEAATPPAPEVTATPESSPQAPIQPPEAAPAAKEPWQMTQDEVIEREKQVFGDIKNVTDKGVVWSDGKFTPFKDKRGNAKVQFLYDHERAIQKALSEGKPVPPEVLKDYPDLATQPHNASEPESTPESVQQPEPQPVPAQETKPAKKRGRKTVSEVGNRATVEAVRGKKWYHGTGTSGLKASDLTPEMTKIDNLFGEGIYLTDNPEIAAGYAKSRGKRSGTPSIYEASDINITGKILDLEQPLTDDVRKAVLDAASGNEGVAEIMSSSKAATTEELWTDLTKAVEEISHQEAIPKSEFSEMFFEIRRRLRGLGYDAFTHTGGKRTGKDPHQVLILLDTLDQAEVGRKPEIGSWKEREKTPEPVQEAAKPAKPVRKPKPVEPPPLKPKKPARKKPKAEEEPAEFGRDVSKVLGIADSVPISRQKENAGRSVQHFFQRFFTSRGELPQEVYDAKVRKEGRVAREMSHLRFASEDFRRGIKSALGGKELTQADVERMNAVLRGEADESKVPEEVRAPLRAMRDHIDSLSRSLIAEGVAQGDLVGTITENMGLYTTRSYRVFDDPKWRDSVPPAVRNRAIAAIRQENPDKSDAEVQGMLESLLFRGAADTPVALLKGSKLGAKDLSTFMKRKDVPEWLRDLWGEYKDAGVNYARSVFKMSHLLANQQFLNSVKESGSGKWLRSSEDGPVVNEYGDVIAQIAAEGSSTMEPLNGMYTTPEIKAAFERLNSPGALPEWLRVLMAVNSTVKYSKTVGSMMTHVRNLISNTGFAVANGHWRLDKTGKALWGTATGLFKLPDAEFRAYYERAAELGLLGEDVRAGELKDALRDASQADIDEFLYNPQARQAKKMVSAGRKGLRVLESLYQSEDAVWKLYAWENEKARYAKAQPDWSEAEVEKRAAEIVRDTYPTYSKTPEAIKGLRRFPLVGTFVSFPAEVVRTTFHTIDLGLKEMQQPETRSIGAQRLAGTVASLGALTVLSKGMMALFGIGDDEDDDLRWFVPPWQENSRFIYTDKPENGTYKFVDLGYSDPHAYLTDAAVAFMRGEDWKDGLTKALSEFLRPFASEEILAKTLMDVRGNDDQNIYNPKDAAGEQAKDIIGYIWQKALEPGTIASLRRINTALKGTDPSLEAKTEVLALTTGQRLQKVDVEHSLGFRVRSFSKALTDIQSIARKTATSRGTVTGEMVATDRERMEKLRLAEFAQMQKMLGAARRLGVPEEKIRALVTGELSKEVAEQVLSGDYAPYELSPQTVKQMLEANPAEFKERFSAWHGEELPKAVAQLRRKQNKAALKELARE